MHRRHAADAEPLVDEVRAELLFSGGIGRHDSLSWHGTGSPGVLKSMVKAWMGPLSSSASAALTSRWRSSIDLPANAVEMMTASQ